jgi:cold shock CspA family protein
MPFNLHFGGDFAMAEGKVKWFNNSKGLKQGQAVEYEMNVGDKGPQAHNVMPK